MLDLSTISQETLIARGQYATVRRKHEEAKKELAALCSVLQTRAAQILKLMQPDDNGAPAMTLVADLVGFCQKTVFDIARVSDEINSLARQRAELKVKAWRE